MLYEHQHILYSVHLKPEMNPTKKSFCFSIWIVIFVASFFLIIQNVAVPVIILSIIIFFFVENSNGCKAQFESTYLFLSILIHEYYLEYGPI